MKCCFAYLYSPLAGEWTGILLTELPESGQLWINRTVVLLSRRTLLWCAAFFKTSTSFTGVTVLLCNMAHMGHPLGILLATTSSMYWRDGGSFSPSAEFPQVIFTECWDLYGPSMFCGWSREAFKYMPTKSSPSEQFPCPLSCPHRTLPCLSIPVYLLSPSVTWTWVWAFGGIIIFFDNQGQPRQTKRKAGSNVS